MKQDTLARGMLWLCLVGALSAARLLTQPPSLTVPPAPPPAQDRADGFTPVPPESLARLVRHDPFRLERVPAPIAYDPARGQEATAPTPGPVRPALALAGLVRGGNLKPGALIEGLPNTDGARLLQVGDTSGGIRVRQIGNDEVVLVGLDTVWTLRVRHPWD